MRWITGIVMLLLAGCATAPAGYWTGTEDGGFCYKTEKGCDAKGPTVKASASVPDGVLDAMTNISRDLQPALDGLKFLK